MKCFFFFKTDDSYLTQTTNEMTTTTVTIMSPAARGAALKREKKAAAVLARVAGKAAAAEKRASDEATWMELMTQGRDEIEKKVQAARKALGVRKNEPNPSGIRDMMEKWDFEMRLAARNQFIGK